MKKFLYTMAAIYVVCAVVGIALFRSPNLSSAFLATHEEEHKRFEEIVKSNEYKLYIERPHLYKASPELVADAAFAKEFEEKPEFLAEQKRRFRYTMFFKVVNSITFIALVGFAVKKPLLGFLDKQISDIKAGLSNAEQARKDAAKAKSEASAKMTQWDETAKSIHKETDGLIAAQLRDIHKEFEEAKGELEKEKQDRRLAEEFRAARTMKEELVNQALGALEKRYRTEGTHALLAANVDSFERFMEKLS